MAKLISFHGDETIKDRVLSDLKIHELEDTLIRGDFGEYKSGKFRGCGLGCIIYSATHDIESVSRHELFPEILGLPIWVAYMTDSIFENKSGNFVEFPRRVIAAIAVGSDLQPAFHRIQYRIQREIIKNPTEHNENVSALHYRAANGDIVDDIEWEYARKLAVKAYEKAYKKAEAAMPAAKNLYHQEYSYKSAVYSAERSLDAAAAAAAVMLQGGLCKAYAAISEIMLEELRK